MYYIGGRVKILSLLDTEINFGITEEMLNIGDIGKIQDFNEDSIVDSVVINDFLYSIEDVELLDKKFTLKNLQETMLNTLIETHLPKQLPSGEFVIKWHKKHMEIGCQKIPKKEALKLADAIYKMYGN